MGKPGDACRSSALTHTKMKEDGGGREEEEEEEGEEDGVGTGRKGKLWFMPDIYTEMRREQRLETERQRQTITHGQMET